MPLDRVIAINGESVKDLDINQAVAKIRGPKGTQVTVSIERIDKNEDKQLLDIVVTRDKISVPSVTHEIYTLGNKKTV
jgi:carboxyl-terminal processing protease